jgi:hypothetical protein
LQGRRSLAAVSCRTRVVVLVECMIALAIVLRRSRACGRRLFDRRAGSERAASDHADTTARKCFGPAAHRCEGISASIANSKAACCALVLQIACFARATASFGGSAPAP